MEDNHLANLPAPTDPKLFVVKCKPTEEREACKQVMQKYFDCLNSPAEFEIFSVTSVNKTQGYIYIEAFTNKHVFMAVANIPIIFGSNVTLVSYADRTQIFENDPTMNIEIKDGQWVRIKKGLYDGDLAQVDWVDHAKRKAMVKLVPRLFTLAEEDENHRNGGDDKEDKDKRVSNLQKARAALKKGIKPPTETFPGK